LPESFWVLAPSAAVWEAALSRSSSAIIYWMTGIVKLTEGVAVPNIRQLSACA
jgi:hypothetical protein